MHDEEDANKNFDAPQGNIEKNTKPSRQFLLIKLIIMILMTSIVHFRHFTMNFTIQKKGNCQKTF